MNPQRPPTTTAAIKPLRKNSYSKGTRKDMSGSNCSNVQRLLEQNRRRTQATILFIQVERLERFERLEPLLSFSCVARAVARRSSPSRPGVKPPARRYRQPAESRR